MRRDMAEQERDRLRAEADRMRPVVEAAQDYVSAQYGRLGQSISGERLIAAVAEYQRMLSDG